MSSLSQGFWGLNPAKADIFRIQIGRRARLPLRRSPSPKSARDFRCGGDLPPPGQQGSALPEGPHPRVNRAPPHRKASTPSRLDITPIGRPHPTRSVRLLSSPADWAKRPGKRGSKHVPEEERIEQHKLRAGDVKGNQHQRKQEQNDAGDNNEDAVPKAPKQKRNRDNNQEAA